MADLSVVILYLLYKDNGSQPSPPDIVMAVIVAYQRSGSSFLGEVFNQNPNAFEWFEPIDGLYSAMYGTRFGLNVPADIWNCENGSVRYVPELREYYHVC